MRSDIFIKVVSLFEPLDQIIPDLSNEVGCNIILHDVENNTVYMECDGYERENNLKEEEIDYIKYDLDALEARIIHEWKDLDFMNLDFRQKKEILDEVKLMTRVEKL